MGQKERQRLPRGHPLDAVAGGSEGRIAVKDLLFCLFVIFVHLLIGTVVTAWAWFMMWLFRLL